MKLARIRYTFELDIPVRDDPDYDPRFDLDENHCLATGLPGGTFERMVEWFDHAGFCWACALNVEQEWLGIREEPNPAEWIVAITEEDKKRERG